MTHPRALLVLLVFAAADMASAGELSVLSYNTHGLPSWVAGDDPERRFPRIGALIDAYDVVLLQEDFDHHALLKESTGLAFIERGNPSRDSFHCWVSCSGSGLTFLSGLPRERILRLDSIPYEVCAGWLTQANDCFATKGFQHAQVEVSPGLTLHIVNTHLDAGSAPSDRGARRQQLAALRAHLEASAAGDALIVAGDLNLDAATPEDAELLEAFAAALGLADSGARAAAGSHWTVLDYIYFRGGDELAMRVLEAGEASEFVADGAPLSDHPALAARFEFYRKLADPPSTGTTAPVR